MATELEQLAQDYQRSTREIQYHQSLLANLIADRNRTLQRVREILPLGLKDDAVSIISGNHVSD